MDDVTAAIPGMRVLDETPCTGQWSGCMGCNENFISYADEVGEYNICKACHYDLKCLDPELDACEGACEVYPESKHPC